MSKAALNTAPNAPIVNYPHETFMGMACDEMTRATLAEVAVLRRWPDAILAEGGPERAIQTLSGIETPQVLVIDFSESMDVVTDVLSIAEVCDPGTRLIAMGTQNDVELYRRLMELGLADYLVKPVSVDALNAAIDRSAVEPETPDVDNGLAPIIGVIGSRGGVGATSVAVNIAWMLAHERGQRVALVDSDIYFGTTALALDLEPGRGFREALESPDRIDGLFIERAMVKVSDTLSVLSAEENLESTFVFNPESQTLLLETLRQSFDCVVMDLPRFAARSQIESLNIQPSTLMMVSDASLAGMRDTLRFTRMIRETAPEMELRTVLNRVGLDKAHELSKGDFERGGEVTADIVLPYDAKMAGQSMAAGKVWADVASRSKAVTALRQFTDTFASDEGEAVHRPFWQRLLKRGA